MNDAGKMRLNRAIASTGVCSRRQADQLIEEGKVKVNGKVVRDFNCLVNPALDKLVVSGKSVFAQKKIYIVLYKPKGIVTTRSDEKGRKTVMDLLPSSLAHLKPVGRLDRDSEGLLILTNDGDLAFKISHPSKAIWKKYLVHALGKIDEKNIAMLQSGVELDDGKTLPARVSDIIIKGDRTIFQIAIQEGRNRQIRRMCSQLGHPVIRLVRVAIGRLQLKPMGPGEWRYLSGKEIEWCSHL